MICILPFEAALLFQIGTRLELGSVRSSKIAFELLNEVLPFVECYCHQEALFKVTHMQKH